MGRVTANSICDDVDESSYIVEAALYNILGKFTWYALDGEIRATMDSVVRWSVIIRMDRLGRDPDHPSLDQFLKGLEPKCDSRQMGP